MNAKENKIRGYTYVADNENELFKGAKAGDLIIKPQKEAPYIVVDHFLHKIIIAQWSGKLYEVEVIDQANEIEINKGLRKDVWYTRTLGVKILKEIPIETIFGDNGFYIKQTIDLARYITEEDVNRLSEYQLKRSRKLYTKAWKSWIAITDKEKASNDNYALVLKIYTSNPNSNSPVKEGLSIVSSQFNKRVKELVVGESAFETDEDGEIYLKTKWLIACEHLLNACISYESDNLLASTEKEFLRKPVKEVFRLD